MTNAAQLDIYRGLVVFDFYIFDIHKNILKHMKVIVKCYQNKKNSVKIDYGF